MHLNSIQPTCFTGYIGRTGSEVLQCAVLFVESRQTPSALASIVDTRVSPREVFSSVSLSSHVISSSTHHIMPAELAWQLPQTNGSHRTVPCKSRKTAGARARDLGEVHTCCRQCIHALEGVQITSQALKHLSEPPRCRSPPTKKHVDCLPAPRRPNFAYSLYIQSLTTVQIIHFEHGTRPHTVEYANRQSFSDLSAPPGRPFLGLKAPFTRLKALILSVLRRPCLKAPFSSP